jgi:phage-related protein (TIGR01555 family)
MLNLHTGKHLMKLASLTDGLQNLVAEIMTPRDKMYHSGYYFTPLSREQIINSYRSSWLPKKIVNIPPTDETSKWRFWNGTPDQNEKIIAEERRHNIRAKIRKARIEARLNGGCVILIGDGSSNPLMPLNTREIQVGGLRYVSLFSMDKCSVHEWDYDPTSLMFNQPKFWLLSSNGGQQIKVHASRVCVFKGEEIPLISEPTHNGFGDSVLESVYQALVQSDSTVANIASLLFESKIDVIKIPNMMQSLGDSGYEEALRKRLTLAGTLKSINGMLVIDGEEEFDQKTVNFGETANLIDRFFMVVSGAAEIPVTRLFGRSAAGMNATGEGDLTNYYDYIESNQNTIITPTITALDEAIVASAIGQVDDNISYTWNPLWKISDQEKAKMGLQTAQAAKVLSDLVNPEAVSHAAVDSLVENGSFPTLRKSTEKYGIEHPNPPSEQEDPMHLLGMEKEHDEGDRVDEDE